MIPMVVMACKRMGKGWDRMRSRDFSALLTGSHRNDKRHSADTRGAIGILRPGQECWRGTATAHIRRTVVCQT
jgi:hypothetical protein